MPREMKSVMKILLPFFVAQFILLTTGDNLSGERPEVGCVYLGHSSNKHGILYPEDLDPSICSQLIYIMASRDNETMDVKVTSLRPWVSNGDDGFVPRLVKLKEVNPDLKLILELSPVAIKWALEAPRSADVITNAVKWLNETGFDGLEFPFFIEESKMDKVADLICDLKREFPKYGYTLSALINHYDFNKPTSIKEGTIEKLARCCNHVTTLIEEHGRNEETFRFAPLNVIKSNVEWMLERGIPATKVKFTMPIFGAYVTLKYLNETELGSKYSGPGLDYKDLGGTNTIRYKELLRKFNDSSLGWTFRRDNETQEPYAFSSTGLWTSYEDTTSISVKARYVLDEGIGGFDIGCIDLDDDEGIGGEGRFPLTRAVYNTFTKGNTSLNTDP